MKIEIKGASINYEMFGEGIPFLMLHGFPMTGEAIGKAIEPTFEGLSGYQRIYPDMPGMGDSTCADWMQTSDDIVEVLSEFIETVIPEKNFLLGGFSYGGYICRALLKRFQERVDGLFLMAPSVVIVSSERDVPAPHIIVEDPEAIAMIPENFRPMILNATAVITKPVIERIRDEILPVFSKGNKEFLTTLRKDNNFACSHDVDDLTTPFDKPTLVLTGRQDAGVGYADAFRLSRNYPRATYVALDRAGHAPYIEQPMLFKLLFNEWLERVQESMRITTALA